MITLNNTFVSYNSRWQKCESSVIVNEVEEMFNVSSLIYFDVMWLQTRRVLLLQLRRPIKFEIKKWK